MEGFFIRRRSRSLYFRYVLFLITGCSLMLLYYFYPDTNALDYLIRSTRDTSKIQLVDITPYFDDDSQGFEDIYGKRVIFFVESDGHETISQRLLCSIESASNLNPDRQVMLIFVKPAKQIDLSKNPGLAAILENSNNVHLATIDVQKAFDLSLLGSIYKKMINSEFRLPHTTDFLRVILMCKFGGIYSDLDIMMIKNMQPFLKDHPNFIMAGTGKTLNTAFIGFEKNNPIILRYMDKLRKNYDPNEDITAMTILWDLIMELTEAKDFADGIQKGLKKGLGYNAVVLNFKHIFRVNVKEAAFFTNESAKVNFDEYFKDSFGVHYWNFITYKKKLKITSKAPLVRLARIHCPKSFATATEFY